MLTPKKRQSVDLWLLLAILTLLGLGIIMVASSSYIAGLRIAKDAFHFIKLQLLFVSLGLVAMFFFTRLDYHYLRKLTPLLLVATPVLLGLVLLIGKSSLGAKRSIDFGFFNFQSSEFAKLAMVLLLAHYFSRLGDGVRNFNAGVLLPLLYVGLFYVLLIMLEPDFGTTLVICATAFCMILAAGANLLHLGLVTLAGLACMAYLATSKAYRLKRLTAFLHPFKDPQGAGWQTIQSLYALGSGGLFGLGIGRSRQKFSYLPEAHTDYIFSILGEELGLIGTLFVLCLFFFIIWRGFKAAMAAQDSYGMLLAVGITSLIGVQTIINIGVITSTLPVTGITLPLVSYGGSSLVVTLAGLGILLNISRQANG